MEVEAQTVALSSHSRPPLISFLCLANPPNLSETICNTVSILYFSYSYRQIDDAHYSFPI